MRRPAALAAAIATALALLAPPVAHATLAPPVRIALDRPSGPAEAGRTWQGVFRITAGRPLDVSEVRIEAPGWSDVRFTPPGLVAMTAGGSVEVGFSGIPASDEAPVTVHLYAGGRDIRQTFVVSRRLWEQTVIGSPDRELTASPAREAAFSRMAGSRPVLEEPRPAPAAAPAPSPDRAARPETMQSTSAARTITVRGRIVYTRSDGLEVPVDGATVRAYDEDLINWQLGSADVTGSDGRFSITFTWDPCPVVCDQDPDIFIEYEAANSRAHVHPPIGFNYKWRTGTRYNQTSNNIDFGDRTPLDETQHPALHMLSTVTKGWRWLRENQAAYDPPDVGVMWLDPTIPGGGYYLLGDIHIGDGRDEQESTVLHEYGHHWVANYADFNQLPDYCNGICDDGFGLCGHCGYCQESGSVALQEGFPNWFSQLITRSFQSRYGVAPVGVIEFEQNALCLDINDDDCPCDPLRTEGFFSALLRDLEDGTFTSNDPLQDRFVPYPGPGDEIADGHGTIFTVMDLDTPATPAAFFADYLDRRSELKSQLWATAKHNTYEFDTANPGQVSGLTSNSHTVNVPSGDHTIHARWTPATDDLSGIAFYVVTFTQDGPCRPGVFPTGCGGYLGRRDSVPGVPAPSLTSQNLPNGNWYVNVLAVDRAGREGTNYRSLGPFVLRTAEPANLTYALNPGWVHEVVPRPAADATVINCPDPTSLSPNANATWLNLCGQNNGEETVSTGFDASMLVDGVERAVATATLGIPPGGFTATNVGPITVGSGRHTVGMFLDSGEEVSELDEDDNQIAYQWVWAPSAVNAPLTQLRAAPPPVTGGWGSVPVATYYNCDGVRFNTPTADWFLAAAYALDDTTDYDCRVHAASTGPTNGFAANLGFSSRGEGCTDAILVNRHVATGSAYDVGVLNWNGSAAQYRLKYLKATTVPFGDSTARAFAASDLLHAFQFDVPYAHWVTFDLRHVSGTAPLHLRVFNRTLSTGDLDDDLAEVVVDSLGRGFISANLTIGSYCVVVFRDAKDGLAGAQYVLEIDSTPPDFEPVKPAGWTAALVPRPAADGTPTSVPLPDTLHGNTSQTYMNLAVRNDSPAASPSWTVHVVVDDVPQMNLLYPGMPGFTELTLNSGSAQNIRGGRHTLSARLDPNSEVEELFETGNRTGGQWIWSPANLGFELVAVRSSPPNRTGGWGDVPSGALWFNCDGLRMPAPSASANWAGVAILPGTGSDYDLRLHERGTGATAGFASNLGYSGWDSEQSDFVLVNFTKTPRRSLDAGVLHIGGSSTYTAEAQQSAFLADDPNGTFGTFPIDEKNLFRLHEVRLAKNRTYDVTLIPTSGNVDLGISLHRGDQAYRDKSSAIAASWTAPGGSQETFEVVAPDTGTYCLAVWKAVSAGAGVAATYRIRIARSTVDAPMAEAPRTTRLEGPFPNPAHGSASIAFELAREAEVELAVYDLAGARVRSLGGGRFGQGRHLVAWNRLDDRGRPAPTGVYWVRFAAAGVTQTRKLVLLR